MAHRQHAGHARIVNQCQRSNNRTQFAVLGAKGQLDVADHRLRPQAPCNALTIGQIGPDAELTRRTANHFLPRIAGDPGKMIINIQIPFIRHGGDHHGNRAGAKKRCKRLRQRREETGGWLRWNSLCFELRHTMAEAGNLVTQLFQHIDGVRHTEPSNVGDFPGTPNRAIALGTADIVQRINNVYTRLMVLPAVGALLQAYR